MSAMKMRRNHIKAKFGLLVFLVFAAASLDIPAQTTTGQPASVYPTRPVRLIVPYTPGAISDLIARTLAHRLAEMWGQQVVVDNRAGGNCALVQGRQSREHQTRLRFFLT